MLRHPFPVAVVVGVPGVGKSTVVGIAVDNLSRKGYRVLVLNYGDYMLKRLAAAGLVRDRDDIRKLPQRIQVENQAEAARMMMRDASEILAGSRGVLVVDTHLLIRTPAGYWPGIPAHVAQELKPDAMILIEASPEEILRRQLADQKRRRADYQDPAVAEELQRLNRFEALVVASFTGASVVMIQNRDGEAERAGSELSTILEALIQHVSVR